MGKGKEGNGLGRRRNQTLICFFLNGRARALVLMVGEVRGREGWRLELELLRWWGRSRVEMVQFPFTELAGGSSEGSAAERLSRWVGDVGWVWTGGGGGEGRGEWSRSEAQRLLGGFKLDGWRPGTEGRENLQ